MRTLKKNALFSFLIVLSSCHLRSNTNIVTSKTISIGRITMEIPNSFKFTKGSGVDSYVAYILNEKNDTFQIEYGKKRIIYGLFDYPPVAWPIGLKASMDTSSDRKVSSSEVMFTKYPDEDNREGVFLKDYYRYDTVGPLIVKIVQPKRIGDGKTGMFAGDLPDSNCLSIYAINLDSARHIEALQIFHTIKLSADSK
jgi:hypothetical protein